MAEISVEIQMREEVIMPVQTRVEQGKEQVGRLRRKDGMLPGVLYGHKQKPLLFKADTLSLERALSKGGSNAIFMVQFADEVPQRAIVREIQYHKVRGEILHVDLLRIDPEERLRVSVPIIPRGTPEGVRAGGGLQQSLQAIDMECVVAEMPSSVDVDITNLEVGDSVQVKDLLEAEDRIVSDPDRTIFNVLAPRVVEEVVPEEEEGVEEGEAEVGEGEETEDGEAE